jgi:aryl sulfotransferase
MTTAAYGRVTGRAPALNDARVSSGIMRRYRGVFADSARWERFTLRPGDVVITTPSKCGTTWMQTIVGMLLLRTPNLEVPISELSPWLDMKLRTDEEVFGIFERQTARRFIKTHTPLDGVPRMEAVTYIAVIRHPLDVALSDRDHAANMDVNRAFELLRSASGEPEPSHRDEEPEDPAEYLRWFIDNDLEPTGSGPYGLADYCNQITTYWDARDEPNVSLFHYADMWSDLDHEMRRVAAALGVTVEEARWPAFVEAATLDAMRSRASLAAPEAHLGLWRSPDRFFAVGGTRDWASLLTPAEIAHFETRLHELAPGAADWVLNGRAALAGPIGTRGAS